MPQPTPSRPSPNSAVLTLRAGKVRITGKVRVTPSGLVAIGGLVSSILLSTAALVWVSTSVARRRPVTAGWLKRR